MYKTNELALLSGVSARTIRYYDKIGLLKPEKTDTNGYRLYGKNQVDKLQQILFYRELGIQLEGINAILSSPDFDKTRALEQHLSALQNKKEQIELLIQNVRKTIRSEKENTKMQDKEKFEGFKQELIKENEAKYGKEVRNRYGDDAIDESNKKLKGKSKEKWNETQKLSEELNSTLKAAFEQGGPSSGTAQKACELHRRWLCNFWKDGMYTKQAHLQLAQGYVSDERFKAYYDKLGEGCTEFLRDALEIYCKS